MDALDHALALYRAASPILKISGLGIRKWRRNDGKAAARTGPWLPARYEVLDRKRWDARVPSIYFVAGADSIIRYTGISRNKVSDRWRECPAIDHETGLLLSMRELHHSCGRQCEHAEFWPVSKC